jgi:hypothetical protein
MTNFTYPFILQDLNCRLLPGIGCGNSTYIGLDCLTEDVFDTTDFTCDLNLDIQNETVYSCYSCLNDTVVSTNSTLCHTGLQLNMMTAIFESALKTIWLKLPTSDFCEWDALFCFNKGFNRTLYVKDGSVNSIESYQCSWNYRNGTGDVLGGKNYDWSFLFVILFIVAGGVGNILVCLAVCLDKRLQNVTNYFLLSLAIADLLVSLFVMPMGAIPGFLGKNILYLFRITLMCVLK